jgi:hypothetical protein
MAECDNRNRRLGLETIYPAMNRFLTLVLIGAATFFVIWLLNNPTALDQIWLYLIGLSGVIIKVGKIGYEKLKKLFDDTKANDQI